MFFAANEELGRLVEGVAFAVSLVASKTSLVDLHCMTQRRRRCFFSGEKCIGGVETVKRVR